SRPRGTKRTRSRPRRAGTSTRSTPRGSASGADRSLRLAEAPRHDGQDLPRHLRLLLDHPVERALEQPDRHDRRVGDHRRAPGTAVEQGDLAEELAGSRRGYLAAALPDLDLALDDHEER